ncbi:MAG TPA: histidine phosphatase family protein, partial [Candidatus Limnocylindria bacterium]|nr:histidine phosphatase family protein [Candidatus Limnocylindria bacterium]
MKSSKPIYWHCKCGKTTIKGKQKITIIAMRHGESGHNVLHIVNGDPKKHFHLTAKGRQQAVALAKKLKVKNITAIIASQMIRTQETARPLAKIKKLKIQIDPRLNDIGAGGFEGTNIFEFKKITNQIHRSVKGSETYKDVAKRLKSFLTDLINYYSGHTVAIVSSEIMLHSLKQISQGLPNNESIGRHPKNGTVYTFHIHSPICCVNCGDRCKI